MSHVNLFDWGLRWSRSETTLRFWSPPFNLVFEIGSVVSAKYAKFPGV